MDGSPPRVDELQACPSFEDARLLRLRSFGDEAVNRMAAGTARSSINLAKWIDSPSRQPSVESEHLPTCSPLPSPSQSPLASPRAKMRLKEEQWHAAVRRSPSTGSSDSQRSNVSPRPSPLALRRPFWSEEEEKVEKVEEEKEDAKEEAKEADKVEEEKVDKVEEEKVDKVEEVPPAESPPSVVPQWAPRSAFAFPVADMQVRLPLARRAPLQPAALADMVLLRRGTRADIYTAILRATDERVVVKMLRKESMDSPMALQEHAFELGMLARVNHPGIVELVGGGDEPRPFLVVEWLGGGTLAQALVRGRRGWGWLLGRPRRPPLRERLQQVRALAEALDYLHARCHPEARIIHRDLKPDNVGFAEDGSIKLFDLGLCACVRRSENASDTYTMTGSTGSLRYMAPEVALGKPYNEKVDVHSFGILAWQMLTGEVPFEALTVADFATEVFERGQRPQVSASWPRPLCALLERCWAADPSLRPSFEAVVEELSALLHEDLC